MAKNIAKKPNKSNVRNSSSNSDWNWYFAFATITVVAFATRLYKIEEPDHVW